MNFEIRQLLSIPAVFSVDRPLGCGSSFRSSNWSSTLCNRVTKRNNISIRKSQIVFNARPYRRLLSPIFAKYWNRLRGFRQHLGSLQGGFSVLSWTSLTTGHVTPLFIFKYVASLIDLAIIYTCTRRSSCLKMKFLLHIANSAVRKNS